MRVVVVLILCLAWAGTGCTHASRDPSVRQNTSSDFRPVEHKANHPPYGTVVVAKVEDARPGYEVGRRDYLNYSFVSNALYDRPIPAMLKSLLANELFEAGVFTIGEELDDADYLLDVVIRHYYARYETSVLALTLIVPSISIEAEIEVHIKLYDQDGRRFLEKVYKKKDDALSPAVSGAEGMSATLLNEMLARFATEFIVDADESVPQFWKSLGLPIPAPGENRRPRPSTDVAN